VLCQYTVSCENKGPFSLLGVDSKTQETTTEIFQMLDYEYSPKLIKHSFKQIFSSLREL